MDLLRVRRNNLPVSVSTFAAAGKTRAACVMVDGHSFFTRPARQPAIMNSGHKIHSCSC
jgi:hypothetical protein